MIPDDRQTLALTSQASVHAHADDVRLIADRIDLARSQDIDQMSSILLAASRPLPRLGEPGPLRVAGYFHEPQLLALASARSNFDRWFLHMMLAHERGAIQLADAESRRGSAPAVTSLAAATVTALRGEVLGIESALEQAR